MLYTVYSIIEKTQNVFATFEQAEKFIRDTQLKSFLYSDGTSQLLRNGNIWTFEDGRVAIYIQVTNLGFPPPLTEPSRGPYIKN